MIAPVPVHCFSITSTTINDKRDDFDFIIVSFFPYLNGDVPRRLLMVNISQLIRFARASHVSDFNRRNKSSKSPASGIVNSAKHLFKFNRRHYELINTII